MKITRVDIRTKRNYSFREMPITKIHTKISNLIKIKIFKLLTCKNGNVTVTKKLHDQLTKVAIDTAFPLASEQNSSLVIIHGMAP